MLRITMIVAVIVTTSPAPRSSEPMQPAEKCRAIHEVGHVPGHVDPVWLLSCH